jgi:hypothetical protein
MKARLQVKIIDVTRAHKYEKYLYKCLAPMPFRKYSNRQKYLQKSIPKGFHKKLLILNEKVAGQIEYAPAEACGYLIIGENTIVMNCIWVLKIAKDHNFGRLLVEDMVKSERTAACFATISVDNHPSPWFRKWQMEKLGFKPIDSIRVADKRKPKGLVFTIYLMWMHGTEEAKPSWDKKRLLSGETFCLAHPLYHPQTWEGDIFETR